MGGLSAAPMEGLPPYYGRYVVLVPEGEIAETLETQLEATIDLLADLTPEQARHRYAPGKWSIKEVVGHLCDSERLFAARLLRFARGDTTPLPGFDENAYVPEGRFDDRPLAELLDELATVRRATVSLLRGLPPGALDREGTASDLRITARQIAWIIAGHELHHRSIFRERYLDGRGPR